MQFHSVRCHYYSVITYIIKKKYFRSNMMINISPLFNYYTVVTVEFLPKQVSENPFQQYRHNYVLYVYILLHSNVIAWHTLVKHFGGCLAIFHFHDMNCVCVCFTIATAKIAFSRITYAHRCIPFSSFT